MTRSTAQSAASTHEGWSPTIALASPWGISVFVAGPIMSATGWTGTLAFAAASAASLCLFGWIVARSRIAPGDLLKGVRHRYTGMLLIAQVLSVSIALLGTATDVILPRFGMTSLAVMAVFVLFATAAGHLATMHGLKRLHTLYLGVALIAAALVILSPASPAATSAPDQPWTAGILAFVVPGLIATMLGPWANIQQWQRAILIRTSGGSVRRAYGAAAVLVFVLICVAAVVSRSTGTPAGSTGAVQTFGCILWFIVAVASTLDSFYLATRDLLRAVTAESTSPLLAFLPADFVATPLWYLMTAVLVAGMGFVEGVPPAVLALPFATLVAGAVACLVCEVIAPQRRYDSVLCGLIGIAATLVLAMGLVGNIAALVALAPVVALVGAFPSIQACFRPQTIAPVTPAVTAPDVIADQPVVAAPAPMTVDESLLSHGFDGQWFLLHLVPTYDDTNSVGNVYFANYFRWVGKTRELFFNSCMPEFDVHKTSFLVLTKSFTHEFRREIREFQPVTVRLKIGSYNRKFVTIVHEIHSRTDGLIGRGEQTIMFVDPTHYKPLDIPPVILKNFLPYYTPNTTGPKAAKTLPILS